MYDSLPFTFINAWSKNKFKKSKEISKTKNLNSHSCIAQLGEFREALSLLNRQLCSNLSVIC
jgi:hypothetical protein